MCISSVKGGNVCLRDRDRHRRLYTLSYVGFGGETSRGCALYLYAPPTSTCRPLPQDTPNDTTTNALQESKFFRRSQGVNILRQPCPLPQRANADRTKTIKRRAPQRHGGTNRTSPPPAGGNYQKLKIIPYIVIKKPKQIFVFPISQDKVGHQYRSQT